MSLPFLRAGCRRTCVGVVVVRRCFGVNGSIFPSGMGKDRRAREGRWVSCNCHALNRFGRRFIPSTPKKGQQTATMHCQPGARVVTLPTAGMGERALRCARARVVFFWRRHSVSGIRCGAWRPGLFVVNQTKPPFTTHKHKHRTKSNQVLAMAMLSRRALRRRLRFRTDRRALGRDARDCGASRRIPKSGTEGSAHKKRGGNGSLARIEEASNTRHMFTFTIRTPASAMAHECRVATASDAITGGH